MTRKTLEAFDPTKLKPGTTKHFEVVNPKTRYHECHYFHRDRDGELFSIITRNPETGRKAKNDWLKLKRAKNEKLKQMNFMNIEIDGSS